MKKNSKVVDKYDESHIHLCAIKPGLIYALWEISKKDIADYEQSGIADIRSYKLIIRLHDITDVTYKWDNSSEYEDFEISTNVHHCQLSAGKPDRCYVADLEFLGPNGKILLLARSNPIKIPKAAQTSYGQERWLHVTENLNNVMRVKSEPNHKGYLCLILHAHLPFVRHPGKEIYLEEEWLFEAMTECYIPILKVLYQFVEENIDFRLTVSLSPPLITMFEDPLLQKKYILYLERLINLSEQEIKRTKRKTVFYNLAEMYYKNFCEIKRLFCTVYKKSLVQAFKKLNDLGLVEIITSAGTHGFLPILQLNPAAVRSQIESAVDLYKKTFGKDLTGIWLPECGYYEGLDNLLREYGIRYFILDSHGLLNGSDKPKYGVYSPVFCPSGVAGFARDPESSSQVWSAQSGYPGDPDYREFYRDIGFDLDTDYIKEFTLPNGQRRHTGIKYYRITGSDNKEPYIFQNAMNKAAIHAQYFMENKIKQITTIDNSMFRDSNRMPIIVAPFDAELFGHWWYEGPDWLNFLFRKIVFDQSVIKLSTPSEYLKEHPVNQIMVPSASTWGDKGYSEVWIDESNDWIYPYLTKGARRLQLLIEKYGESQDPLIERALKQAVRELMLAQSSDWAFIIKAGTTVEYAYNRIKEHIERFNIISDQIRNQKVDKKWLEKIEYEDNIFPDLTINMFAQDSPPAFADNQVESVYIPWLNFHQPDIFSELSTNHGLINHIEALLLDHDAARKEEGLHLLKAYHSVVNHLKDLVEKDFAPNLMLTISGPLMNFLHKVSNEDMIKDIPEEYRNILDVYRDFMDGYPDVIEIVGSGCYHPSFADIPEEDFSHQIEEWKRIFALHFGKNNLKRVTGFWAPELDLTQKDSRSFKLIKLIQEAGYKWLLLSKPLSEEYSPNRPYRLTLKYNRQQVTIVTIFGDPVIANMLYEQRPPTEILHTVNQPEGLDYTKLIVAAANENQKAYQIQSFFPQIYTPLLKMTHDIRKIRTMTVSNFLSTYYSKGTFSQIAINCEVDRDLEIIKNEIKKLSLFFNSSVKRYLEREGIEFDSENGKKHPAFGVYKDAKHLLLSCESSIYCRIKDDFTNEQIKKSLVIAREKILKMHQILNPLKQTQNHQ
ncbi:MAG: 1,4-alpha-glucan branching protein domain-containing protein [bacterium]